jgi:hypothetical protein
VELCCCKFPVRERYCWRIIIARAYCARSNLQDRLGGCFVAKSAPRNDRFRLFQQDRVIIGSLRARMGAQRPRAQSPCGFRSATEPGLKRCKTKSGSKTTLDSMVGSSTLVCGTSDVPPRTLVVPARPSVLSQFAGGKALMPTPSSAGRTATPRWACAVPLKSSGGPDPKSMLRIGRRVRFVTTKPR